MLVTDSEERISELSCHVLMILPTNIERVQRFVAGFHSGTQTTVAQKLDIGTSYKLVVEIARSIEGVHHRSQE